jgi:hypothetical protein
VLLLGGFLCPVVLYGGREVSVLGPWSLLRGTSLPETLGILVSPLLGAASLGAAHASSRATLAKLLAWLAAGAWIVSAILSPGMEGTFFPKKSAGSITAFTLMPICACSIAIGNHLRKRHPMAPLPRSLAGTAGIVLVLCFVLPIDGSTPLLDMFLHSISWRMAGPVLVVLVGLLAYGALGIFSFKRLSDEASYTRLVSILGRALLVGAPLTLLFTIGILTSGWGLGIASVLTLKLFATWYGHWILFASSLAAWMGYHLLDHPTGRPPTASPRTRARPASPPGDPART